MSQGGGGVFFVASSGLVRFRIVADILTGVESGGIVLEGNERRRLVKLHGGRHGFLDGGHGRFRTKNQP